MIMTIIDLRAVIGSMTAIILASKHALNLSKFRCAVPIDSKAEIQARFPYSGMVCHLDPPKG